MEIKKKLKKLWWFIWEDDSVWSWLVNIILAYVLIKFIIYPGLGLIFATSHPIVAVVSDSMMHDSSFENWWENHDDWYIENDINKGDFIKYPFLNGFNKGDIMILTGRSSEIKIGDVIVFRSGRPDPIIHRVVKKWQDNNNHFQTKGDNNPRSIKASDLNEMDINEKQIIGKAFFRIPLLGYIKIWAVEIVCVFNDFNFCIR